MAIRIRRWLVSIETVLALWLGWVLVFAVPFRMTAGLLGGTAVPANHALPAPDQMRRARGVGARTARVARRMPWRTTCLVQATAGYLLLKRRGIPSAIRFGVATKDSALAAHAWLIVGDGIVLGGETATDFQLLAELGHKTP